MKEVISNLWPSGKHGMQYLPGAKSSKEWITNMSVFFLHLAQNTDDSISIFIDPLFKLQNLV